MLTESGIVRSDLTSSFGSASATAQGVPLTVSLTVLDVAAGGTPAEGAAVYLWHCDREGRYSLYDSAIAGENYLRGVQAADAEGALSFTTIWPGAYSGRWPHIHFEVYPSLAEATSAGSKLVTSQIALPEDACQPGLRDRRVRAERAEPRPDLAGVRHGVRRRLLDPAGHGLGLPGRGDGDLAQRGGVSDPTTSETWRTPSRSIRSSRPAAIVRAVRGPAVDEAGVELHQRRPGGELLPGVVGGEDPADADHHQAPSGPRRDPRHE